MPNYAKKMIPSAAILGLDLVIFLLIPSQVRELTADGIVTTRFMPYIVTILIGICAAVDLIQTFREGRRESAAADVHYFNGKGTLRVLLNTAAIAGYLLLLPYLGFVIATFLLSAATMLLMGERSRSRIALLSVILSVGVYCVFKLGLSLRLPAGLFFF